MRKWYPGERLMWDLFLRTPWVRDWALRRMWRKGWLRVKRTDSAGAATDEQ